jgi:hypothetical protein
MLMNIAKKVGLFAAGLLLGLIVFMPLEGLWEKALQAVAAKISPHTLAWLGIQDASMTGFTLTGFSLKTQQGTVNLSLPAVRVRLGLSTLAEITASTGPALTVSVRRDKTVTISGGLDLAALNRKEVAGVVTLTGDLAFPAWGSPPSSGRLNLAAETLNLPGGLTAGSVQCNAQLSDTRLSIDSFSAEKPLPVKAQGSADLNWQNPRASTYSVSGSYTLAGQERTFQKAGTLEQVPGM